MAGWGLEFVEPQDVAELEVELQMVTWDVVVGHGKSVT